MSEQRVLLRALIFGMVGLVAPLLTPAQEIASGNQPGSPYKEERYKPPATPLVLKFAEARVPSSTEVNTARAVLFSTPGHVGTAAYEEAVENKGWDLASQIPAIKTGAEAGSNAPFIEVVEIERPNAAWIRLTFKDVDLQKATLHVSSQKPTQQQTFSAQALRNWENSTAIFDGSKVRVLLQTQRGAGFPNVRLQDMIDTVSYGVSTERTPYPGEILPKVRPQAAGAVEQAACDKDKRKLSKNKLVGRMRPAACTAFLIGGGIAATAGHCLLNGTEQVVSFNVPDSDWSGAPVEPNLQTDVYRVLVSSIQCRNCAKSSHNPLAHGNDWALFRLSPNLEGATAESRQGEGYAVDTKSRTTDVLIYGFGWDTDPPQARYASQASVGPFVDMIDKTTPKGVTVLHLADTAPGSSGSPIVWKTKPETVVGIHVAGSDCAAQEGSPNVGTSFTNTELAQALDKLLAANKDVSRNPTTTPQTDGS